MLSAVILAGGRGERLFPLTGSRPKPLCPVNNIPPLVRAIKKAEEAGAKEIIVTAHHMASKIKKILDKYPEVKFACESTPLGTAGAVANSAPSGEDVLVLSGDAVFDFDLKQSVAKHSATGSDITIITSDVSQPTEYGVVSVYGNVIERFVEKPSWTRVTSDVVNTGIYIIKTSTLDHVPTGVMYDFAKDLFPFLMEKGIKINTSHEAGYWCDIGSPTSFYGCNMHLSGGKSVISSTSTVSDSTTVNESVVMENVSIGANSMLDRCIICENVKIGDNCIIPEGCIIGANTVVSDDVVFGRNVVVTNNVFIGKRARIMKNIYFGEVKKRLFDNDLGVGGTYGSTFDTADAVYLGQSLCQMEKSDGHGKIKIGVMHADNEYSRVIADALICGIRYGGGECYCLEDGFDSLCGFCSKEYDLDFSVYAKVSQDYNVTVSVFDKNGLYLSREGERRLENIFYRRSPGRIAPTDSIILEHTDKVKYLYANFLLSQSSGLDGISFGISRKDEPNNFLYSIAEKQNASAEYTDTKPDLDLFTVSPDGFYLDAVTKSGRRAGTWHFICCYYAYKHASAVRKGDFTAYINDLAPSSVSEFLQNKGIKIEYYNDSESSSRNEAAAHRCLFDGNILALNTLNIMKESGKSLDELLNELPSFFVRSLEVEYDEEQKAAAARRLADSCDNKEHGLRFVFEDLGSVVIAPSNGAAFRIFAESVSAEVADELCELAKNKLLKSPVDNFKTNS